MLLAASGRLFLDLRLRLGLVFGDLLLRSLPLLVAQLVEVGRLGEAHGYEHRTVRAWSEPFGHRVVGLAGLSVLGQCSVIGLAEVEGSYGSGEEQQHNEPYFQGRPPSNGLV